MKDKRELRGELNTAEAASFLGVSEASVRRWGDGGLFPMGRVGQRRQRRFRRADLAAFLEYRNQQLSGSGPVVAALAGGCVAPALDPAHLIEPRATRLRY